MKRQGILLLRLKTYQRYFEQWQIKVCNLFFFSYSHNFIDTQERHSVSNVCDYAQCPLQLWRSFVKFSVVRISLRFFFFFIVIILFQTCFSIGAQQSKNTE